MVGRVEFRAVVEAAGRGGHVVAVPDEAVAEIGGKHMLRVKGALAGVHYRSNLATMGGRIILGVHKETLAAAGKETRDEVTLTMEVDTEPSEERATRSSTRSVP